MRHDAACPPYTLLVRATLEAGVGDVNPVLRRGDGRLLGWNTWVAVVLGLVFLLVCVAHVLMYSGAFAWPGAATVSMRAFAGAMALVGASLAWARYAGRGTPLLFLLGAALSVAGLFMMVRTVVTLVGYSDATLTHLFMVSVRSAWAQDFAFAAILLVGVALLPARGEGWREPWRLITLSAFAFAVTAVGVIGAWSPAFPGTPRPETLVARPDYAWTAALHLILLVLLWQRDDVRAAVEGRWLTFAVAVSFMNQILVLPFWPQGAAAAASALGSAMNVVVYVIITVGLLIGTFVSVRAAVEHQRVADRLAEERDQVELALARHAARLQRANEELGQYAYVASHDLQEPLRMVSSYVQLIERRYGDLLDDDGRDFIRFAVDGAVRMKRLTNDLLVYSRVSGAPLSVEPIDLGEALRVALQHLEVAIAESDATVTSEPLPSLSVDPTQMVQLFQNLVGNAIKFRRPGTAPHVSITARREGPEWIVSVRDDGVGIDPRYRDKVFAVFQRLHRDDEVAGTGIGLALCKKIVERHGGRIWFEGRAEGGTVFHVALPVDRVTVPPPRADAEDPELHRQVTTLVERARELI
jgi:signal transduction histidine kinase